MKTIYEKVKQFSITKVSGLKGKKIILRIDVNIPLGDNKVVDPGEDWRIIKSYASITYLVQKGACVIVMSHIGRDKDESLRPVYEYMRGRLDIGFIPRYDYEIIMNTVSNMQHGSVVMIENLRQHEGEKNNDSSFLDPLIDMCDMYVNDAFSVSHRSHASVNDITNKLPSYFGLQFVREVEHLSKFSKYKDGNTILVLGGAKFGTKFDLLKTFLPKANYVLIGGALANVFLKERGFNIGASFVDDSIDISEILHNEKLVLPVDVIDQHGDIVSIDEVSDKDIILDIGPETEKLFETIINYAKLLVWNGPMGKYEDGYVAGSLAIANSIAQSNSFSVIGGGDTATIILKEHLEDSFDFISTGGGAMLKFMIDGSLVGIEVIINKTN